MLKDRGLIKGWLRIFAVLYCTFIGTLITGFLFRNGPLGYALSGISFTAGIFFCVLLWFVYNLPHKLNMFVDNIAEGSTK